jgi:tetratricopeptide (TPR) repeat protein
MATFCGGLIALALLANGHMLATITPLVRAEPAYAHVSQHLRPCQNKDEVACKQLISVRTKLVRAGGEWSVGQRQELPPDTRQQIEDLLRQAGEAQRGQDAERSEKLRLQAWDLLPEPKLRWEFYSNIMPRSSLIFYRDTKQFEKAMKWLEITRESYGPDRNDTIEFLAATLWYEMGDFDKAFEEFDRQYAAFRKRPFEGEDKKYLDFYLSRKTWQTRRDVARESNVAMNLSPVSAGNIDQLSLPAALADEIDRLAERGNVLLDERHDWRAAIDQWEQALVLLPEPRSQWAAWTWLNASIGDAYWSGRILQDAKATLFDALNGPDGQTNPFILLRLGQTLVDLGDTERGIEYLLRACMLDGEDVFKGDGAPYLRMLRDRNLIN